MKSKRLLQLARDSTEKYRLENNCTESFQHLFTSAYQMQLRRCTLLSVPSNNYENQKSQFTDITLTAPHMK